MQQATDKAAATGKIIAAFSTALATALGGSWLYIGNIDNSRVAKHKQEDLCARDNDLIERRHAKILRHLRAIEERLGRQDELLLELSSLEVGHAANPKRKLSKPLGLIRAEKRVREN